MRLLQTDRGDRFAGRFPLLLSFAVASVLALGGPTQSAFAERSRVPEWPRPSRAVVSAVVPGGQSLDAGKTTNRIRLANPRIVEVFRYAMEKSTAFQDLVATLELADRVVYVEEGSCRHQGIRGCLTLMPTPGGKHILIRIAPRELINLVAAHLAHELYHAAEVGREPTAIDDESIRALYGRIGERSCGTESEDCWETRAAVAFETLVRMELNGVNPLWPWRHHRRD